ncbi:litaf-like zinc ribbon domain protein, partial [Colletotrichum incanum]
LHPRVVSVNQFNCPAKSRQLLHKFNNLSQQETNQKRKEKEKQQPNMSEPQATQPVSEQIQQPPPAYSKESPAKPAQGSGPAPLTEMPASPVQPEQQPTTTLDGQKSAPATVTPLHMLGDAPAFIDCPFCQKRAMANTSKEGTGMQVLAGALCCLLCVCLTCVPCLAGWCEDTHYSCSNCHKKVATRPYDGPIEVFGPQPHAVVPSRYQPVASPVAEKQQNAQA